MRAAAATLFLFLALTASVASAQSGGTVQQAAAAFEAGRFDDVTRLLAAYAGSPTNGDGPYWLGRVAMERSKWEQAGEYFEKAIALKPSNADYHYWLGNAWAQDAMHSSVFRQGMMASKIKGKYEQAVRLDPNHLDARFSLMQFYVMAPSMMGGSMDAAKVQAAEILKRDAARGHIAFANIYANDHHPELVEKELHGWVTNEPNSAKAHAAYGGYLMGPAKDFKGAETELLTAIRLDPAYLLTYFRLGQLSSLTSSNYPRGEEALRKYLTYHPKEGEPSLLRAHYWLGMVLEKQGKKDQARAEFQLVLKANPDSKEAQEALKRVS